MAYPVKRELDGMHFHVMRNGRWESVCYSDMTAKERDRVAKMQAEKMPPERMARFWRSMVDNMADRLYELAEQFGYSEA